MQEIKINEEKENLLFNRKEISFNIQKEQTPSRAEVLDVVAEKFSTPKENIKIKNIGGRFGSKDFNVNVFIYDSEEEKNRIEIKKKKDAIPEKAKEEEKEENTADADIGKNDNTETKSDGDEKSVEGNKESLTKENKEEVKAD